MKISKTMISKLELHPGDILVLQGEISMDNMAQVREQVSKHVGFRVLVMNIQDTMGLGVLTPFPEKK